MQKSLFLLTTVLAWSGAGTIVSPAQAAPSQSQRIGRAAIQASYNQQSAAYLKKNVDGVVSFYAPDFQMYDSADKGYDRAQTDEMLRRAFNIVDRINTALAVDSRFIKHDAQILSLTWRGKDAIVMTQTTIVSLAKKDGRSARSEIVTLNRDYWTPTAQGWKMRQSVERQTKAWLNGERMI